MSQDKDERRLAKLDDLLVEFKMAIPPPENQTRFQKDYPMEAELLFTLLKNERRLVAEINQNRQVLKEMSEKLSSKFKYVSNLEDATILVKKNTMGDEAGTEGLWRQKILSDFMSNKD